MNAYSTRGRARIRQSDLDNIMEGGPFSAANALRALEWRRSCEAEAELVWTLKQHGVNPQTAAFRLPALRQAIGAALVRAGERLAGTSRQASAPETLPAASTAN